MRPEDITDAVRAVGGCGAISPDGERACVQAADHAGSHGWEEMDANACPARGGFYVTRTPANAPCILPRDHWGYHHAAEGMWWENRASGVTDDG